MAKQSRVAIPQTVIERNLQDLAPATGFRSTARLLSKSAAQVFMGSCAETVELLDSAEGAASELEQLIGNHAIPYSPPMGAGRIAEGLRADTAAIERLIDAYSGAVRLTAWRRFKLRKASLAVLLGRVSARIGALRAVCASGQGGLGHAGVSLKVCGGAVCGDWSPVSGEQAEAFGRVLGRTQCVFARRSVIWTAPWTGPCIDDAVRAWAPLVRGFAEAARRDPVDGLVLALPGSFGDSVDRLAATTRQVLDGLAAKDGRGRRGLQSPERQGWYFTFAGERMFLVTMAPCYPADHARHSFGEPYTFLLLQADRAFDRAVSPGSGGIISSAVRSRIRELYDQHGRPYDLAITLSPFEAYRFVKPLALGEPPVRWWEARVDQDDRRSSR
ncbi:YqcI/YcgG family protein [Streptomyces sp. NBC_00201]|uniref:YqcI/YcgG family protein n=1 Tax=Streptomyces sp. NBC_00201 TaxID=2975679 RepID=UPI00225582D1|nr:YqcI/YcgG family protein [Streptomyces sp. NBC_00201]MCX5247142.1 YqcI/YcgG family protein [Streptomyces sp. NBC_00201]